MITAGGHTFDETLLGNGIIIDVGCRGFEFANWFTENTKTSSVVCIDPDTDVFHLRVKGWNQMFLNVAISDKEGTTAFYRNGEATCLKELDPDQNHPFIACEAITMDSLYKFTGDNVDVLKLDCEGAEYMILGETFKPIPKQITVEFHHHTVPDLHNAKFPEIIERLSKDYEVHNMKWEPMHGCGFNYWDVLFKRKY